MMVSVLDILLKIYPSGRWFGDEQRLHDLHNFYLGNREIFDQQFLQEFNSSDGNNLYSRLSELIVALEFKKRGYKVSSLNTLNNQGPDFLIKKNEEQFFLEIVTPTVKEVNGQPITGGQFNECEIHEVTTKLYNEKYIISLNDKEKTYKKYVNNAVIDANIPRLVCISNLNLSRNGFDIQINSALLRVCCGIEDSVTFAKSNDGIVDFSLTSENQYKKFNGSQGSKNFFDTDKCIDGAIEFEIRSCDLNVIKVNYCCHPKGKHVNSLENFLTEDP